MKHVKNLIEKILKEKKEMKDSSKETFENQNEFFENKKNLNEIDNDKDKEKDISFDNINIIIPINKTKNQKNIINDINKDENINKEKV